MADGQILREVAAAPAEACAAYLCGAAHDGTVSRRHRTLRISQAVPGWLEVLQAALRRLGSRGWIDKEGASRSVWVLETSWRAVARWPDPDAPLEEVTAYVRGYFDAEGGLPQQRTSRFYVQFAQKDRVDLQHLQGCLERLGVKCGRMHNPSVRVAPDYWRFYIGAASHDTFARMVSSWHPIKRRLLESKGALRDRSQDGRWSRETPETSRRPEDLATAVNQSGKGCPGELPQE